MFLNSLCALVESQILYKTERSNLVFTKTNHLFLFDTYLFISIQRIVYYVVEPNGVEPLTSCVQGRRSTN